jgi:hypothetical protein
VYASGYVETDFEGPWGSGSPVQRLKMVWRRLLPTFIVVYGVYFATAYVFFKYQPLYPVPALPVLPTMLLLR